MEFGLGRAASEGHAGRPMGQSERRRMSCTVEGRVMNEMLCISPPQAGQRSGST